MNLEKLKRALKQALEARTKAHESLVAITEQAEAEERDTLTEEETEQVNELRESIAELDKTADDLETEIAERQAEDDQAEARAARLAELGVDLAGTSEVRVNREEDVYRPDHQRTGGASFLVDLGKRGLDFAADERLRRHAAQMEQRAATTGPNTPGIIPPNYLGDMLAEKRYAGRNFLNLAREHDLPEYGMTLTIPEVTTGTSVAEQVNELDAIANQDIDSDGFDVSVKTHAGETEMSYQLLDRGFGTDDIVTADLAKQYAVQQNTAAITDTLNATRAIQVVTYDSGSPSAEALFAKFHEAQALIEDAEFMGADVIVMRPTRWHWLSAQVTANHPFVQQFSAPQQMAGGANSADATVNVVGTVAGLPVVTDALLPNNLGTGTDEDPIVVASRDELHSWEDPSMPVTIAAERIVKASNLTVRYVIYGYSAFTGKRRPSSHAQITGTGLVTPTF